MGGTRIRDQIGGLAGLDGGPDGCWGSRDRRIGAGAGWGHGRMGDADRSSSSTNLSTSII